MMDENSRISVDPCRSTSSVIQKGEESIVMHENPATKANFLSKLFFCWLTPFIRLGNKKPLQVDDLYQIHPNDESEKLGGKLEKEWMKELNKIKKGNELPHLFPKKNKFQPSLTSAIRRAFGLKIGLISLLALFEDCGFRIIQPIFLGYLIRYFDTASGMKATEAYMYATGIVICSASYAITQNFSFQMKNIGMQIRVAICSLMFKKCLVLSQTTLGKETSLGQVANLMSNDVNRFDIVMPYFHYMWITPLQAVITTTVLYFAIGPSCFVGLVIIVLYIPFQGWASKMLSKMRLKTASTKDERIKTMNEIIGGIRVIKMYTWENSFITLINLYRKLEVNVIRRMGYLRAFVFSISNVTNKLIPFLPFVFYELFGNHVNPEKVFMALALLVNLRIGLSHYFPSAVSLTLEAKASLRRIQEFLLLDEFVINEDGGSIRRTTDCTVIADGVTAKWPASANEGANALTNVSFTLRSGQIMAIVGQVGSGKSSLLNAILGELPLISGNFKVRGKVAYASQEAWIFSGTIRENILCGSEYTEQRYHQVVEAAALERDFTLLPKGDHTLVGERGINLSGGQKAQVNLARCLYVDADVYLIDDPLSAVDTHVGRHLYDKAINGFLKDKIRILVTHQLQYLKEVDMVLVLKDGQLKAWGNPKELSASGHIEDRLISSMITEDNGAARSNQSLKQQEATFPLKNDNDESLIEEFRQFGSVRMSTYWKYFRSGGGIVSLPLIVLNLTVTTILTVYINVWITFWTQAELIRYNSFNGASVIGNNVTQLLDDHRDDNADINKSWKEEIDIYSGVNMFFALVGAYFVFSLISATHFFVNCTLSSIKLHDEMLKSILCTSLSFFDTNPIGRILNRYIKDIGCMDDQLPENFLELINVGFFVLGIEVLLIVLNWWLSLPAILLFGSFHMIRKMYVTTSFNVRRLEARSPVLTHLSSALIGLTTLKAHQCDTFFQKKFDQKQDVHSSAYYLTLATARWFAILSDWTLFGYSACITYGVVALHTKLNGSEAGLVLTAVMFISNYFYYGVQKLAEVENLMTSTERVIEYGKLKPETALETTNGSKPPPQWPQEGDIRFEKMSLSYGEHKCVLKSITCHIKPKEKIGIVGRTGAGKSSLIAALFRLTNPDGKIIIDGIDTKNINLHDLRSKISIIPQDPMLFTGNLRKNLDPFGEFNDDVLCSAVEDVQLKESMATDVQLGLDFMVAEGGSNLSVGQRQLVCLARTIFRKNRILILDEATANVDQMTDRLIQIIIKEKFKDCTVLTIAHRLDTIMDSDKVMVLDAGYLMEFDSPSNLIENKESMFRHLLEQSGN